MSMIGEGRLTPSGAVRPPDLPRLRHAAARTLAVVAVLGAPQAIAAEAPPAPPSDVAERYAGATDDLGYRLLTGLMGGAPSRTVVISPLSVASGLALAAQGAKGAAAAGFAAGLGLTAHNLSIADAGGAYAEIASRLGGAAPGRTLHLAVGVWADTGVTFKPAFIETAKTAFSATAASVDFSAPKTLAEINGSIAAATGGKIVGLLAAPPPRGGVVLVDALYFKADWSMPFDRANTREAPFTGADGVVSKALMMRRSGEYDYLETDAYQALALPYLDRRFELVVVLPRPGQTLTPEALSSVDRRAFTNRPGDVSLPRLHLAYTADLLSALRRQSFGAALGSDPDLSGMTSPSTTIGQVVHAAVVDVDEQGSEGAAATAVISMRSAARPPPPFTFTVDRPFYLVLRERLTGADLFVSFVAAPGAPSPGPSGGGQ
jgi:serpin B